MVTHRFQALGTVFTFTFFDEGRDEDLSRLAHLCEEKVHEFDALYSRFKSDSLVTKLSKQTGTVEVPEDLVAMLRLYQGLNKATAGKINPCIGFALEDIGYDAAYSLTPRNVVRAVPSCIDAVTIEDDTHITLHQEVLLDLGALGKGFVVDLIHDAVREAGVSRFLIDGSGDIRYFDANNETIVCGLEDPRNPQHAIGTLSLAGGALCASAVNRRVWRSFNHYLDPESKTSPEVVAAVWVKADTAALADGLSSALFFVAPEELSGFSFEYLILNKEMGIKKSAGFTADFFTAS